MANPPQPGWRGWRSTPCDDNSPHPPHAMRPTPGDPECWCRGAAWEAAPTGADGPNRGLRVTVEDLDTGDTETADVPLDDYLILTTGKCELTHVQTYANGTHVLTVKNQRGQRAGGGETP